MKAPVVLARYFILFAISDNADGCVLRRFKEPVPDNVVLPVDIDKGVLKARVFFLFVKIQLVVMVVVQLFQDFRSYLG